ncbi:MAG: hypothetical protein WCH46_04855 [bacterium]
MDRDPVPYPQTWGANPNIVFGDEATVPVQSHDPANVSPTLGFVRPKESLFEGFSGVQMAGDWTLTIYYSTDTGDSPVLKDWGIYFK